MTVSIGQRSGRLPSRRPRRPFRLARRGRHDRRGYLAANHQGGGGVAAATCRGWREPPPCAPSPPRAQSRNRCRDDSAETQVRFADTWRWSGRGKLTAPRPNTCSTRSRRSASPLSRMRPEPFLHDVRSAVSTMACRTRLVSPPTVSRATILASMRRYLGNLGLYLGPLTSRGRRYARKWFPASMFAEKKPLPGRPKGNII